MDLRVVAPVPPLRGGIAQHSWQIIESLRMAGHEVRVESWRSQYPRRLFPGHQPPVDDRSDRPGVRFGLRWWSPVSWWRAGRRSRRADLVMLTWATPFHGVAQWVFLRAARGVPAVVFVHNPEPHERMPFAGFLLGRVLRRCRGAVVHSEGAAGHLRAMTPTLPVRVVGHPLNLVVERSPLPPTPPLRLLFLGFVRSYKGVDLAVEAVAAVRETGHDVRLTVSGDFWQPVADLQALVAELGLQEVVELRPGYVADDALSELFAEHHALIAPYRSATASGVVPLALAAGRPVLVTPVGGLPESVRHGVDGLVADEVSVAALAAAMAQLADALPELAAAAQPPTDSWRQVAEALLWEGHDGAGVTGDPNGPG